MITYSTLSKKASAFHSLTGLTVKEFDRLYEAVLQRYEEAEGARLDRPGRQRKRGAGRQFKHDQRERLLMALIWLRVYPTYEVLGVLFDLHKSNVWRNLAMMLPLLQAVSARELRWPVEGQRQKQLAEIMAEFPDVRAIVDATEQPIRRPKDKAAQKSHYSGKKKRHTLKTQVVVALARGERHGGWLGRRTSACCAKPAPSTSWRTTKGPCSTLAIRVCAPMRLTAACIIPIAPAGVIR